MFTKANPSLLAHNSCRFIKNLTHVISVYNILTSHMSRWSHPQQNYALLTLCLIIILLCTLYTAVERVLLSVGKGSLDLYDLRGKPGY